MKINIKNFQSIENAEIEIGPLTVLVGQSDVGKSAIIRALYLLHRNKGGLELLKYGASKLSVEQQLQGDVSVSIHKGKGVNAYSIKDKVLSKIGKDVPDEVSSVLRTDELQLDKDQSIDLNFSRQFDTPFLLSDSSSVVTKAVSSLSGINIIYSAIREANSEYQKLKTKHEILSESLKGLIKYENLYKEAEELKNNFGKVSELERSKELLKSNIIYKKSYLDSLVSLEVREINLVPFEQNLEQIQKIWVAITAKQAEIGKLASIKDRFFGISEYTLSKDFEDSLRDLEDNVKKLTCVFNIISEKQIKREKEVGILAELAGLIDEESTLTANYNKVEEEYNSIKNTIKVCEACGRPLD